MLILMTFLSGYQGDLWQEHINGYVTRWFDLEGNEVTLPSNGEAGVSYTSKDPQPPIPSWYTRPE